MKVLLDTCTFLWAALDAPELSERAREIILDESTEAVLLSSVSAWEIAIKNQLGRLLLPAAPERYIPQVREQHGFEPLPLDEEAVLYLSRLPDIHRDPFDRMLACQAMVHGLTVLTPDRNLDQYPIRTIW